jgi:hypothetical protein
MMLRFAFILVVGGSAWTGWQLLDHVAHGHGDHAHFHHAHMHRHHDVVHFHGHAHHSDDVDSHEDSDTDHHEYAESHGEPAPLFLFTCSHGRTRDLNAAATWSGIACENCDLDGSSELHPPEHPPRPPTAQDSIPHLRTIVLLT